MRTIDVIEGINIISKYYDDLTDYDFGADRDSLYMFETDRPISNEDLVKLKELGWTQEKEIGFYEPTVTWCADI